MQTVTTIGLDIAKSVFQVHGIDAECKVIKRRNADKVDPRIEGARYATAIDVFMFSCCVRAIG